MFCFRITSEIICAITVTHGDCGYAFTSLGMRGFQTNNFGMNEAVRLRNSCQRLLRTALKSNNYK